MLGVSKVSARDAPVSLSLVKITANKSVALAAVKATRKILSEHLGDSQTSMYLCE